MASPAMMKPLVITNLDDDLEGTLQYRSHRVRATNRRVRPGDANFVPELPLYTLLCPVN